MNFSLLKHGLFFLLALFVTAGLGVVFAQTTPATIPVSVVNGPIKTNAQCNDGATAINNVRLYKNTDVYYPYETYYSSNTSVYFQKFLFGANQSKVELNNMNYNTFSLLGDQQFHIKSRGKPLNVPSVIVGRLDNGMKAVSNHPSDTTQQAAQFTYELQRKAYSLTQYGGFTSFGAIGPFGYVTSVGGSQIMGPLYNPAYSDNDPARNISGKYECYNMYVSRCGDGYIDTPGSSVKPGYTNHSIPLQAGSTASEQCDPGTNLNSWTDDVMPNGTPATALYNCTATCTIVNTPLNPPYLTIDKQQKLLSGGVFSGVGLGTPSDIGYTSPAKFEFKIIITNTGGDATNVVMRDVLPVGFIVDPLPAGCSGTTSAGIGVACNAPSGGQITSQSFNLLGGQTATFTIIGTLTSNVPTVNKASATYTDPTTGTVKETPIDVVDQHPQTHIPPQIVYTKTVRNVTTNSNGGSFVEADNLSGGVLVNTGDRVEYEITIQKLTGTVVNTILSDVLPTNNGFIMSGYSINGGAMITASSFPATNITALLNSGNVVVKLYGAVGNPTATQFVNTALLTENGIPAGTVLPGSNVAWTYLPTIKPNPKLYLQKYWINPNNPNQTGDHYTVPANTPIKFILRVTNIGNVAAAGVINDACPTNLTCQSYRILPSTVSVSYNSTIPVGTVAVGGYVEVEVSAIAYPNGGTEPIRNLAKLYRVCTLEEDIADGVRDGLCHENDDDATLEPQGNNQCGDGVLQRGEQCDLKSMPATIGNYLDLTFNHPSVTTTFNHRGKTCNTSCQIIDTNLNICGDGKLGRLEQCDLGANMPTTIGSYLDTTTTHPSGTYNGSTCSASCVIEGENQPEMPACWYGDTMISIMKDEIFPFSWDIELPEGDMVSTASQCANNDGKIVKDSLTCDFRIYNRNGEVGNSPEWLRNIPCYTDRWGDDKLFEEFRLPNDGERDPLFVKNPIGTYYINTTEFERMVGGELGEYKLSLNAVNYQYCQGGTAMSGKPYARVCQVNFAVTDHYLMQKGSVSTTTNSDLKDYFLLDGKSLYEATDLKKIDLISSLNYADLSPKLKTLTDNLIAKYKRIAVTASVGGVNDAKKVPGQSIYIMPGGKTFNGSNLPNATTIIVEGDITIKGDVDKNSLIIATGKVRFDLDEPSERRDGCQPQTINGIVVARGGFITSSNDGFKNDDLNQPRCRKGNLIVKGALVGDNLEAVVNSRRSHLEHWFTFLQNGATFAGGSNGDSRVRAERRDEVYQGASVSIEQNPSLWRDVPPGADEFLRTLNISRN